MLPLLPLQSSADARHRLITDQTRFGLSFAPSTLPSRPKSLLNRMRFLQQPSMKLQPDEEPLRTALAEAAIAEGWAEIVLRGSSLAVSVLNTSVYIKVADTCLQGSTGGYKVGSTRWHDPSRPSSRAFLHISQGND